MGSLEATQRREIAGPRPPGRPGGQRFTGLSIGLVNYTRQLRGVQLGLANYAANNPRGLRLLPLVNIHL